MAIAERHLLVLWSTARYAEAKILADVTANFSVRGIVEIAWSRSKFSENLTRFYGQSLPPGSDKERHCGTGPLLAIVVDDSFPAYAERQTTSGRRMVNTNIFDAKAKYRSWTGGGHRVHGTTTAKEFEHDYALLLSHIAQDAPLSTSPEDYSTIRADLAGANGWSDGSELFNTLNATVEYVVLRNFEGLPETLRLENHGDIDLLSCDSKELTRLTNARKVHRSARRAYYHVRIGGADVPFDFRATGDGYFDETWQRRVLERRELDPKGFYRPSQQDYLYTLLYHAVVHKPEISDEYARRLMRLWNDVHAGVELERSSWPVELKRHMQESGYAFVEPRDYSVHFNPRFAAGGKLSWERRFRSVIRNARKRLIR